jgi:hypothetical protein
MAGEDLSAIIGVFLDDQATGPLQALPAEVRAVVQEIDGVLSGGMGAGGLLKFREDLAAGTLSADQLLRAIAALGTASGLTFDIPGTGRLTEQLDQLQLAALRAKTALREMGGGAFDTVVLGGGGGIPQQEALLAEIHAQRARASDEQAIAATNARGAFANLAQFGVAPGDEQAFNTAIADRRTQIAELSTARTGIEGSDGSALEANANATKLLRNEVQLLTASYREATVASAGLGASGAVDQAALNAEHIANIRGAANPNLALAESNLQMRANQTDVLGAQEAGIDKVNAALGREAAQMRQVAAIQKEMTAATASAGGGGFLGGLGHGLVGGNGDASDPFNMGRQLGDIARYIYVYEAFYKITEAIKESIHLTKEYENGLVSLQVALTSVGQQGAVSGEQLASVGASAGFTPGESLTVASRGIQAFHDESSASPAAAQAVALQTVDAAQQGVVLSGQKVAEVQNQVIATTRAYELGVAGQTRVLDAATNANINFGASIKDVMEGLAQVAGIGKESGFTVEQLANTIGLITSTTGLSGSSAAGDLKRILGGAGAPAFQKALEQVGVDTTNQSVEQQLTSLAAKYKDLTQAQQENVLTTLGGRRSAESLIPLLESSGRFAEANAFSLSNAGAAADQYAKRQDTLAGILRQLGGISKELLVDLGQSGIGAGFGIVLEALIPLLRALDEAVKVFGSIPAPIRNISFALLEMAGAIKLLEAASVGAMLSRIPGIGAGAAVAVEGEAAATLRSAQIAGGGGAAAGLGIFGAARGVGGAAVGAVTGATEAGALQASIMTLGAVAAPAAIALGALTAVIVANKASNLAQDLGKVNDVMNQISDTITRTPTADTIQTAANTAAGQAAKLHSESSGFLGSISDFLNGGAGADQASSLKELSTFLSSQAAALAAMSATGNAGPQSVQQLDAKVQELTASGHTSAQIVDYLSRSIHELGNQAKVAQVNVGGLTTGAEGGAGFATQATTILPGGVKASFGDRLGGIGTFTGAPDITPIDLGSAQKQDLQTKIESYLQSQGKDTKNAVLDSADLGKIADLYATQAENYFGLSSGQLKEARDKYLAALTKLATQPGTVGKSQDTSILDEAVAQILKAQQGKLTDANARGADTGELLKIQQDVATQLEAARASYKDMGAAIPADLKQKILVAGKDAYDAFQKRILELANIAKTEAGSNQNLKSQIDAQTVTLLRAAEGIDPSLLPTSITNLANGQILLSAAMLQNARNLKIATDAFNAAQAEAKMILARAQANVDAASAALSDTGPNSVEAELKLSHSVLKLAGAQADAANIKASVAAPNLHLVNDPSAVAGIDLLKAQGTASAKSGDTAAQIAAAARLASIYPGASIERDAAEIQRLQADLAKQTPGTVAYYNALASLHQGMQTYRDAVLAAHHVSGELVIDLTNPLAVANEALRTAQAKLNSDRANGAPGDVLNVDRLAVQQAANAAANTKFQQNLSQVQTNYDLERITQAQYLKYLDAQHAHLFAIHNRTQQQQDELNQIDKLLQEAAKQLQGQFNLGSIKLPTPFEVRRSIAGGASAANGNVQYVSISVNGADTAKVTAIMATYLGPGAFARATTTTAKV